MKTDNISSIINTNTCHNDELAFQMLIHCCLINKKNITVNDLKLFYNEEDLNKVTEKIKDNCLQDILDYKETLKEQKIGRAHV